VQLRLKVGGCASTPPIGLPQLPQLQLPSASQCHIACLPPLRHLTSYAPDTDADASGDISMADLRGPGKAVQHPLPIKPDTWQEVRSFWHCSRRCSKSRSVCGLCGPLLAQPCCCC
jgi:hypothetical protein